MPPEQVVLPASKGELIVVLRALASRRPKTREEMKQLQDDSLALALHIQRRMSLHDVPEPIWHFLSDPDVRFKDPSYAEMQLRQVGEVLLQWEAGATSNNALERTRDG